jgi:hypothetical protein
MPCGYDHFLWRAHNFEAKLIVTTLMFTFYGELTILKPDDRHDVYARFYAELTILKGDDRHDAYVHFLCDPHNFEAI